MYIGNSENEREEKNASNGTNGQKQPSFISQIDEVRYQEGKSVKMDKSIKNVL